ncbi:hypothetical protein B4096_0181 [Heyndrickxia coagulans]|nr:hypothetical protein B4096_0181 [Heyndrickxia coagulans]
MHDGKSFFRIVLLPFYPEPQALSRCRYLKRRGPIRKIRARIICGWLYHI